MDFVLFEKLAELKGIDLIMLVVALVIIGFLVFCAVRLLKKRNETAQQNHKSPTHTLVFGAICISLAFILSYIKLFSMPLGGSITLCSMLPLMLYSAWFGPVYGFGACFVYGILQVVQGAYIVHWAQFLLDYFIAFTIIGSAGFFRNKMIPLGILVSGILRMLCSTVSGAIFFGAGDGWNNAWTYSLVYNLATIGIDTFICFVVYMIPGVGKSLNKLSKRFA